MSKKVLLIVSLGILVAAALSGAGCASGIRLADMLAKGTGGHRVVQVRRRECPQKR